jgi:hypothetical protein
MIVALAVVTLAMLGGVSPSSAGGCGTIRDSAMCASTPNCYYDVNQRHCLEGTRPREDACAVHGDEGLCDADAALGCKWNAARSACASKSE